MGPDKTLHTNRRDASLFSVRLQFTLNLARQRRSPTLNRGGRLNLGASIPLNLGCLGH